MRFPTMQVVPVLAGAVCLFQLCFGYRTFFLEDECHSNETIIYNTGSDGHNSSGIMNASRKDLFLPSRDCVMILKPPLSYGIVISIKQVDFRPGNIPQCNNYIRIYEAKGIPVTLCGYSNDASEYQSYSIRKQMKIVFHTGSAEESGASASSQFSFTFTAYRKQLDECTRHEFHCRNDRCIWKGLTCDGHNNCGDLSDESKGGRASCGKLSTWATLGIVIGTIVTSLIVIIGFAWLRRHKITEQIERLSENSNSSSPPRCGVDNPSINDDRLSSAITTTGNSSFYRERSPSSSFREGSCVAVGVTRTVRFRDDEEDLLGRFHLPGGHPHDPPPKYESPPKYGSPPKYEP